MALSIQNGRAIVPAWLGQKFQLWSSFVTAVIQMPNFSCAEPNTKIIITTYFASSLTNCIRNGCGIAGSIARSEVQMGTGNKFLNFN